VISPLATRSLPQFDSTEAQPLKESVRILRLRRPSHCLPNTEAIEAVVQLRSATFMGFLTSKNVPREATPLSVITGCPDVASDIRARWTSLQRFAPDWSFDTEVSTASMKLTGTFRGVWV
jgi:hypothetical protein